MAKAFDYLKSQPGLQFDPAVIDALMARRDRVQEIFDFHSPAPAPR
jgi:two-component system response regulator RpfG